MATNDIEAFQREYVELCLKHGFEFDGCGCCGSPWISPVSGNDFYNVPNIPWPKEVEDAKPPTDLDGNNVPPFTME